MWWFVCALGILPTAMAVTCPYAAYSSTDVILTTENYCPANSMCNVNNKCFSSNSSIKYYDTAVEITAIGNMQSNVENAAKVQLKDMRLSTNTTFLGFRNISHLDLSQLQSSSAWGGVSSLYFSSIGFLGLTNTIYWPSNLKYLDVLGSFANITSVPRGLPNSLDSIDFRDNFIIQLDDLPDKSLRTIGFRNNSILSITNRDWKSVALLDLSNNPLETFAFVQLSSPTLEFINFANCNLNNITIDTDTAAAINTLKSGDFRINQHITTDSAQCNKIGGEMQFLLQNKVNYTITACVLSNGKLSTGTIVGISIGALVGVIVIATVVLRCIRRKNLIKNTNLLHHEPYHAFEDQAMVNAPNGINQGGEHLAIQPPQQSLLGSISEELISNDNEITPYQQELDNSLLSRDTPDANTKPSRIAALFQDINHVELDVTYLRGHRLELMDLFVTGNSPIASGAYGEVWMGTYGRQQVAIKRLKSQEPRQVQVFIDEIILWSRLDSDYIVKFVGASWTRPIEIECVAEYMNLGDLRSYLIRHKPTEFTWDHKYNCITSIVQGLIYLHMYEVPIIHRDLKSRNVLMDSVKGTKLTDFGTSRVVEMDVTMTNGIGTFQWMAPEVIAGKHYSTAADIYSFGIILSELCTHQVPYANMRHPQTRAPLNQHFVMNQVCAGKLQPSFDGVGVPEWVSHVALQCIQLKDDDRPTALDLSAILRQFKP